MTDEVKKLNKEQLEAVKHGEGPLLIIAGAGTGKTTVITERIKYLILEKGVLPSQVLALTFTDKAAREMEERVDVAMPYGYTQMWISTFHSFCDRILRSEAIHIGLNPTYRLLGEAESILFLRQNLFKFELNYFRPLGNPNKFLEGILQHFNRLKDEDVSTKGYLIYAEKLNARRHTLDAASNAAGTFDGAADPNEVKKTLELAHAYQTYEELKVKEDMMDFADLISNVLKLFRTRPNILGVYQKQFKYILVDEFQDTNFAQNELAILLSGVKKNITVVGDDDQAIYRWRGAAISNIIQFKKYFPKTKVVTITKNYRSTKEILNRSYLMIQHNNPDRLEVKEKVNKKLESVRNIKGEPIEFLFAERVEDEAEIVVKKIATLKTQKETKDTEYQWKDFAILVRANDHSQPFVRALSRRNIPYQFLGPGQLFHQEEIKDLIAYLKVLYNFEDSASLYRVLNMPIFDLDAREIAAILNFARRKNLNLFEALEKIASFKTNEGGGEIFLKEKTKEKIKIIFEMIKHHLKRVPKDTAGQLLYYFLEDSGLLKNLLTVKNQADEKKSQNISKFFDRLKTYEVEHQNASVFAVVDWIDLSMQMGESPLATNVDWQDVNAVNILTIHSSKGLEFKVVFLVNLVAGRFPTRERREQIPIPDELVKEILPSGDYHLEEERRLFYVGMTRAKDNLFLTASNFYGEGKRERKISPFVYEALDENIVSKAAMKQSNNEIIKQLDLLEWSQPTVLPSSLNPPPSAPITYLSYSQIQTFDICPLHYKLRYILKIPTPPTSAQSFGVSAHTALRDFYQKLIRKEPLKIEDIYSILEKVWINEGYQSKAHEQKALEKAKMILKNYLQSNLGKTPNPLAFEIPFQFFLKNPKTKGGELKIGGRIDRVDRIDANRIEIIDYKTGNNLPNEKELAQDLQLTFYALAATEVNDTLFNKKPEDVLLSLHFLEAGKILTTTRTKDQIEKAKSLILEKAEEIQTSDFSCSRSNFCKFCEYKMLCHV